ncbi:phosphoglycerate mutase-like protein [Sesbania bispinosa]|nr:phosphoglycerate mutase-like protein [Sesbania bispinosa]
MSSVSASPSSSSRLTVGDGVGWADGIDCCEEVADKSCHPGVGIIVNAKREGWSGGRVDWTDGGEDWTDGGVG